jgi:hypothetical protein
MAAASSAIWIWTGSAALEEAGGVCTEDLHPISNASPQKPDKSRSDQNRNSSLVILRLPRLNSWLNSLTLGRLLASCFIRSCRWLIQRGSKLVDH